MIIKEELSKLLEKFRDKRRTQLVADPGELRDEDLIPDEKMAIFITNQGYIKRVALDNFSMQGRGGRGKGGLTTREDDYVKHFFVSSNHSSVLFFTNRGVVYDLKVYDIPESSRQAKGSNIANVVPLLPEEKITAVIPVSEFKEDNYLVMLTKQGFIKKTELSAFESIRSSGIIGIVLGDGDELGWVAQSDGTSHIIIGTSNGFAIRFNEAQVRPSGRKTRGVKSLTLRESDSIVSFDVLGSSILPPAEGSEIVENLAPIENEDSVEITEVPEEEVIEESNGDDEAEITIKDDVPQLLTVTRDGIGKRTPITLYRVTRRGGMGITNIKLKENDKVTSLLFVKSEDEIMIATVKGMVIRQKVSEIRTMSRSTKGVKLQRLDSDDEVVGAQLIIAPEEEEEES